MNQIDIYFLISSIFMNYFITPLVNPFFKTSIPSPSLKKEKRKGVAGSTYEVVLILLRRLKSVNEQTLKVQLANIKISS